MFESGWADALAAVLDDPTPTHVARDQLLKHALALRSQHPSAECHLVYCYWEPRNAEQIAEFVDHRQELEEFAGLVAAAEPTLHVIEYPNLWGQWQGLSGPAWLSEHVAALRQRYDVDV